MQKEMKWTLIAVMYCRGERDLVPFWPKSWGPAQNCHWKVPTYIVKCPIRANHQQAPSVLRNFQAQGKHVCDAGAQPRKVRELR